MASAPLLLAVPSAWASTSRRTARAALLLLALLVVAAIGWAGDGPAGDAGRGTFALDTGLVEGVRHGGDFYGVAADLVRGGEEPARPGVGVRLPTLATIAAALPRRVLSMLLAMLTLAVALAWYERLAPALARRPARIVPAALLLAAMTGALRPESALLPEAWAGLFLALSLARWRPDRAVEAIAWALAAALIDETAVAAILVGALLAGMRHDWRELAGWAAALLVLGLVFVAHRHAVDTARIVFADAAPSHAAGIGGLLADLLTATALAALPAALGAALLALSLAGWGAWRDPLAPRVLATSLALLVTAALSPAGSGVALLAAPLSLVGLTFLPDGLRDLAAAALDRRRIVVRRVLR